MVKYTAAMRTWLGKIGVAIPSMFVIAALAGWVSSYWATSPLIGREPDWKVPRWWCMGTADGRIFYFAMEAQWIATRDKKQSPFDDELRDLMLDLTRIHWSNVDVNSYWAETLCTNHGWHLLDFGMAHAPLQKGALSGDHRFAPPQTAALTAVTMPLVVRVPGHSDWAAAAVVQEGAATRAARGRTL
ncbi:MAG: hypothetical protein ACHRHE_21695 [Tepidisphaerales bacterium]